MTKELQQEFSWDKKYENIPSKEHISTCPGLELNSDNKFVCTCISDEDLQKAIKAFAKEGINTFIVHNPALGKMLNDVTWTQLYNMFNKLMSKGVING